MGRVRVSAPATIANLGPGFDVFGLALSTPRDIVELKMVGRGERVRISESSGPYGGELPLEAWRNTAGIAAEEALKAGRADFSVEIRIEKGVKPSSGMGSSAASAAAAAFGVNILMGGVLKPEEVIQAAAKGETASAGAAHADNVAPSILGGFTIILSYAPLRVARLEVPDFKVVLVTPNMALTTRRAREVLPKQVSLGDVVAQVGGVSQLLLGLFKGDVRVLGEAVNRDVVVEPARAILIPGFHRVKRAALDAGAYGCSLSGSGPSLFAICEEGAEDVAEAMVEGFAEEGVDAVSLITSPSPYGCLVV
jgi:homoserine kinase